MGVVWRLIDGRRRLLAGMLCGALSYLVLPTVIPPGALAANSRAVLAWDTGVLAFLVLVALLFTRERASRMRVDAERQQYGEWTIFVLTLAAVVFSFVALFGEFADTKDLQGPAKALHVGLVGVTLLLSWLMTHTTFAFRYAHEFYQISSGRSDVDGGLDFPGGEPPDYLDFMYFALVLGMTFQVSDVQITSRKLRRLATVHGVLSFLFSTIIVALSVNIAAGLV